MVGFSLPPSLPPSACILLIGQMFVSVLDTILEYFLEAAMKDFIIGRVDHVEFHPDYQSHRVVMYVLVKK